ncbi:MAG: PIN domain-containing protein, partial [Eggerthellaceae bacterium]|nr:PIN domain-containing protein [Eggerthellaceae bacterium]
ALRQFVHMRALLEDDIDAALASNWDDFEDACVYQAALHVKPDAIVTNNVKDFDRSSIPVFDCQGLFDWIEEKEGISYAELAFGGGEGE